MASRTKKLAPLPPVEATNQYLVEYNTSWFKGTRRMIACKNEVEASRYAREQFLATLVTKIELVGENNIYARVQ